MLNGTTANFTVFAPTDKAFEKIPKHKEPSKEFIKKLLLYHVSPDFYPAGRVLHTHTIPTLYKEPALGSDDFAQRLSVNIGFKGLTLNFYSRIVAIDIVSNNLEVDEKYVTVLTTVLSSAQMVLFTVLTPFSSLRPRQLISSPFFLESSQPLPLAWRRLVSLTF